MSAASTGLDVRGLAVRFGDAPGLEDLSFDVRAGARLAIVGPSGVGKSTLLRAIAGLGPLDAGQVLVNGMDVTRAPPERRNMVYLHQSPALFPHLSVVDNVAFAQRVRGATAADAGRDARALMLALGLQGLEGRRPETLSGGQRHRAALARALMARPAVLLLDEPLGALDPSLRAEVRDAIRTAQTRMAGALVLVTHDLDEALTMGDEVAVLLDGVIAQRASPRTLSDAPASLRVARFLQLPNIIGTTRGADGTLWSILGSVPMRSRIERPVLVARADALRLVRVDESRVHAVIVEVQHRAQFVMVSLQIAGHPCQALLHDLQLKAGDLVGIAVDWQRIALVADA